MTDYSELLSHVDHTLLTPTATWPEIRQLCDEGIQYGCASVCIPPSYVKQAADYLDGRLPVCTVIGFPNGYNTTEQKCREAAEAVINLGWVKEQLWNKILDEIRAVRAVCPGHILKVIVETCLLTERELWALADLVSSSGADYIKTSTGFSTGGATRQDVGDAAHPLRARTEDQGRRRHRHPGGRAGFSRPGRGPAGYQPSGEGSAGAGAGVTAVHPVKYPSQQKLWRVFFTFIAPESPRTPCRWCCG